MYFVIAIKFAKESQKISHSLSYDYCNRCVRQSRSTLASFGLSVAFVPELREFKFRSFPLFKKWSIASLLLIFKISRDNNLLNETIPSSQLKGGVPGSTASLRVDVINLFGTNCSDPFSIHPCSTIAPKRFTNLLIS